MITPRLLLKTPDAEEAIDTCIKVLCYRCQEGEVPDDGIHGSREKGDMGFCPAQVLRDRIRLMPYTANPEGPRQVILREHKKVNYGDYESDLRCELCTTSWPCAPYVLATSIPPTPPPASAPPAPASPVLRAPIEIPVALPLHAFLAPELAYIYSVTRVDDRMLDVLKLIVSDLGGEDARRNTAISVRAKCQRGIEAITKQMEEMNKSKSDKRPPAVQPGSLGYDPDGGK